jgi:hypothetical protein
MGQRPECDDEEVQAILDAGAGVASSEWVAREFGSANFRDKRLTKRLLKTAEYNIRGARKAAALNSS